MKTDKLVNIMQQDLGYCDPALKKQFHNTAKARLRKLAAALGLSTKERDIRSNMGGIAVSGEVTLHADWIYVQIAQSSLARGNQVLYRRCNGRKDYSGGQNHFASAEALRDVESFAMKCLKVAGRDRLTTEKL